ncbi:hypothetical protein MACH24_28080 [Erythrobacter sp. Dej080120_24]|uniref:Crp/Fnr family transcriptional regulator n=1 Tax=Erythrobacter sp. Dej080120_24 TaxID=3024837 RepID=UPI00291F4561|nr:hypothetical protein MACH24_28080 [Erythrobacter sp. Dej080120_24]
MILIKDDAGQTMHSVTIMATVTITPEQASMDAFRDTLVRDAGSDTIADKLCAVGEYQQIARGGELPVDPDEDRLVFIASGSAKLFASSPARGASGDEAENPTLSTQVLAFHFPGDIVSVLRQADGDFRLAALSDLEVVIFRADQFLDVAQNDPAVIRTVLARSLQALHRSRTRMMQMGHKSARQRIADFLVSIAERICGRTSGECEFNLPMSRRDIGDSLGLTIETVSRQFADLKAEGLIETNGRSGIRLCNLDALASRGGCQ